MLPPALVLALVGAGWTPHAAAHPLHSSVAEISYEPREETVIIRLRVFRDDLAAVLPYSDGAGRPDSAWSAYARGSLALVDRSGRPAALQWSGAESSGDTIILTLTSQLPGGLQQAQVFAGVMWERFPDQVNIVRASYSGRTVTLLFTRGDSAKSFP